MARLVVKFFGGPGLDLVGLTAIAVGIGMWARLEAGVIAGGVACILVRFAREAE